MEPGRGARFVLITHTVVNHGTNYIAVNPLTLRLVTADRTRYDVDLPATYALRMERMIGASGDGSGGELAGGGFGTYVVVFRVPDDVARGKFSVVIRGRASVEVD
jgi:hypothetical protein